MNTRSAPELLAPAGNHDCVTAAIENGADAIYFGLDCGFNARHRAANFSVEDLAPLAARLRRRGVRGYVTLNTLVFDSELDALVAAVEQIADAGIDAVLVQDLGVAKLIGEIRPDLEIHASTQMSLSSAETIAAAADLNLARVVLPRELSIAEIGKITAACDVPVEVFVHGALCVAYSGQCLTSESVGGRSANRGQCAQACRLPYELVVDGERRDLGDVRYLLSPQDLAGHELVADLIDAGVASLKIEGRLKTPEYVANTVAKYRRVIDDVVGGGAGTLTATERQELELSFSRGLSTGWLAGNDHKQLVPGLRSAKQGLPIGRLLDFAGDRLRLTLAADISLGDGIAVASRPTDRSGHEDSHQGGRVVAIDGGMGQAGQTVWMELRRGSIDDSRLEIGGEVFKSDDPRLGRRLRESFAGDPAARRAVTMRLDARVGEPLQLTIQTDRPAVMADATGPVVQPARNRGPDRVAMADKLGRLGGTGLKLVDVDWQVDDDAFVPASELNQLRRVVVESLLEQLSQPPKGGIGLRPVVRRHDRPEAYPTPQLGVLCRAIRSNPTCRGGRSGLDRRRFARPSRPSRRDCDRLRSRSSGLDRIDPNAETRRDGFDQTNAADGPRRRVGQKPCVAASGRRRRRAGRRGLLAQRCQPPDRRRVARLGRRPRYSVL